MRKRGREGETNDLGVADLKISAVSSISTINVDWSLKRLSAEPT